MRRVGLLAGLLVLVLGSGVAAYDATPVPSPWYAPDDLAYALPPMVADIEMDIYEFPVGYHPTDEEYEAAWRDVLVPLGKDPMDVRAAVASSTASDRMVFIEMVRVDGVQAADVWEGVWRAQQPAFSDIPVDLEWEWQDIAGRRVVVLDYRQVDSDVALTHYVYPKGEALFTIVSRAADDIEPLPIEDVLAELP